MIARYLLWLFFILVLSCKSADMKPDTTYAIRLKPGEDLKLELEKLVKEKNIEAGWISTGVGSLTHFNIRFANQPEGSKGTGHFEIVSLTGTLSINGSHLHISISDSTGKTIGGHLLEGNKVYTTVELVVTASDQFKFLREKDGTTEWPELTIVQKR